MMMIAAAEVRISAVEFDLGALLGWNDGDETLATGAEGSAAGTAGAGGAMICGVGGGVTASCDRAVPGCVLLGGTLLGATSLGAAPFGATMAAETFPDEAVLD